MLIDTIEELEEGTRALGRKCVSFNEPFFAGHFPGNPVMPGVLIVEALAQVGAVALLGLPEWKGRTAYFAGINKARFKQKVLPAAAPGALDQTCVLFLFRLCLLRRLLRVIRSVFQQDRVEGGSERRTLQGIW